MQSIKSLKLIVGKHLPNANCWQTTLAIILNTDDDIINTISGIANTSLLTEKEVVESIKDLMNSGFKITKTSTGNLVLNVGDAKYIIDLSKKKKPKDTGSMEMFVSDDTSSSVGAEATQQKESNEETFGLIQAIKKANYEMIDKLLEGKNIDYDYKTQENEDILSVTCEKNDIKILTKMVEAGLSTQDGLMWACQNGNQYRGLVPFFIKHGASPNITDSLMPLQWAIFTGAVGVAQELIENGADLNYISDSGESLLQIAVDSDNKQVVELMIINGANLNVVDREGNSPLHWAVSTGAIDVVRMLLYNNADATKTNNEGKTPRDLAISLDKPRIQKILKKHQA